MKSDVFNNRNNCNYNGVETYYSRMITTKVPEKLHLDRQ